MRRRDFIKDSVISGSALVLGKDAAATPGTGAALSMASEQSAAAVPPTPASSQHRLPDLRPARWLWYPSERTLQNTFVLFRRALDLPSKPRRATGWISADSRYLLSVNGERMQWGPAPCDPRWLEADPVNITGYLRAGANVIGAQVLFYGQGDGTSPLGKPGFLFWLEIELESGEKRTVVSDANWQVFLARAWKPGQYKRWYVRSLQEEFDARLFPYGWNDTDYKPTSDWLMPLALDSPADKPPLRSSYPEYMLDVGITNLAPLGNLDTQGQIRDELRARSIPLMHETVVPALLAESMWIEWIRPPEEYFEYVTPHAYRAVREPSAVELYPRTRTFGEDMCAPARPPSAGEAAPKGKWTVELDGTRAAALTFELYEQMVGWPYFVIEAPQGTIVELMVHEAHELGGPALLNTHFNSWSRFICREGVNRFETFDFEGCRWIQLHIRGARGKVTLRDVGIRRRVFPWPQQPVIRVGEPALQRLMNASVNTLNNSAQETFMDGVGRERQQYSGDCAHQLHPVHLTFGETRLPARFLTTFSQGMTLDGFFLDTWPAYDRLARLMERQLHLTAWGPLLDHGVGFNFDCYYHYLYSGNLDDLREPYPRLLRFAQYLERIVGADGLLPVENIGVPSVWIDHIAFQKQRHKQCAFNLYASAMLIRALAPICRAMGDPARAQAASNFGNRLLAAAVRRFWSPERGLFVNNLPWLREEKEVRMCDRSLATSVLFDQCPEGRTKAAIARLADVPPEMGLSYPANAGWRLWALGKGGRADIILKDFRERWATMDSVRLNNTLQEDWKVAPDSDSEWSHCPFAPLYVTYMSLAGINPLEAGFKRCEIRPQLADLESLELVEHSVRGPIGFHASGKLGGREISLSLPPGCEGELVVRREEKLSLKPLARPSQRAGMAQNISLGPAFAGYTPPGHVRYRLPAGETTKVHLHFS
jgi:hypothetical protein